MSDVELLQKALVEAQAEMPAVEPDAVNPHFRSKFVSLDHLIAKTRPVLNRHGLAITQSPTHIDGAPALETTLMHASGARWTSVMPLLLGKNDMQGMGGAITYARRYAWASLLGISSDEDDDGERASTPAAAAPVVRSDGKQDAKAAKTWAEWKERMRVLEIPTPDEWLQAAALAAGVTGDKKWGGDLSQRANRVLLHFSDNPPKGTLGFWSREELRAGFAVGFDGAVVDVPEIEFPAST